MKGNWEREEGKVGEGERGKGKKGGEGERGKGREGPSFERNWRSMTTAHDNTVRRLWVTDAASGADTARAALSFLRMNEWMNERVHDQFLVHHNTARYDSEMWRIVKIKGNYRTMMKTNVQRPDYKTTPRSRAVRGQYDGGESDLSYFVYGNKFCYTSVRQQNYCVVWS